MITRKDVDWSLKMIADGGMPELDARMEVLQYIEQLEEALEALTGCIESDPPLDTRETR